MFTTRNDYRRWATRTLENLTTKNQRRKRKQRRDGQAVEALEDRALLATFTVSNLNDAGAGSLRQAIADANGAAGADDINFTGAGASGTITLTTGLIQITDSVSIAGPGSSELSISGNDASIVFQITDGAGTFSDVSISGVTVTNGMGDGGFFSGAIDNSENLTLDQVHVTNNETTNGPGGLEHLTGTLVIKNSTFSLNRGGSAGGGGIGVSGGSALLVNTTLTGGTGRWGSLDVLGGAVTVRNSTITGNHADPTGAAGAGGGVSGNPGLVTIHNTIVAGNMSGASSTPSDAFPGIFSGGTFNLIADAGSSGGLTDGTDNNIVGNAGSGTITTSTILNTTLANNGGPTRTHALVPGSPAIDAGSNAEAEDENGADLTTDQRGSGFLRRIGTGTPIVDIGAVEAPFFGSLVVSTDTDVVDGNYAAGELSLREAVNAANHRTGADTITFDPSLNGGTITLGGTELDLTDEVTINGLGADQLTIDADGGSRVFHVGVGVTATLSGLSITGGDAEGSVEREFGGSIGGGILNEGGTLTVTASRVFDNSATFGGGINNYAGSGGTATLAAGSSTFDMNTATGNGGGIYNWGNGGTATTQINNTTVSGNDAQGGVGGIFNWTPSATVAITNSTVTQNTSTAGGGGLHVEDGGNAVLNNTLIAGNTTNGSVAEIGLTASGTIDGASANNLIGDPNSAGGLVHGTNGNILGDGAGNAIAASAVIDTTLADNGGPTQTHALPASSPALNAGDDSLTTATTDQRGVPFGRKSGTVDIGAYEAQTVTLNVDNSSDVSDGNYGSGELSLREAITLANANPGVDGIDISATGIITLLNGELPVTEGIFLSGPGANQLTISGNDASRIFNLGDPGGGSQYVISDVTLSEGFTTGPGGAVLLDDSDDTLFVDRVVVRDSEANGGGGLWVRASVFQIRESAFIGNTANFGGSGILTEGANNGWIINSTFSGNTSGSGDGAIQQQAGNGDTSIVRLRNLTIADSGGHGVRNFAFDGGTSTFEISNTLLDFNTGDNVSSGSTGSGVATETSIGFNLSDDGSGNFTSTGDQPNTESLVPFLADNGGLTPTYALPFNSPAIDAGSNALAIDSAAVPYTTDQRGPGFDRIIDSTSTGTATIDIGAFEAGVAPTVTVTPTSGLVTTEAGGTDTFTVVLDSQPSGDVTFQAFSNDSSEGLASPNFLTFTTSNWDTPQTITVTGQDDPDVDGDIAYTIDTTVFGGGYDGVDPADVMVTNTDDDVAISELVVSTNTDISDGNFGEGELSLREAIELANGGILDAITFNPLLSGSTITLTSPLPLVSDNLTIAGLGASSLTVSGNDSFRVFDIDDSTAAEIDVTISDLTVQGGSASGAGGIRNLENLTLRGVRVVGNTSTNAAGGLQHSEGTLLIEGSSFSGNTGLQGGGLQVLTNPGTVQVINSTFSGNVATAEGGGIAMVVGAAEIRNTTITDNRGSVGGGLHMVTPNATTLDNSIVAGNFKSNGTTPDEIFNNVATGSSSNNVIGDAGTSGGLTNGTSGNIIASVGTVLNSNLSPHGFHALPDGSPAINAGSDGQAVDGNGDPLVTDQRMQPRFVGTVDIGSYEKLLGAVDDSATTTAGNGVAIDVTANDSPGTGVSPRSTSTPGDGTAAINGNGTVQYTPDPGFDGTDTFTYEMGLDRTAQSSAGLSAEEGNAVAIDGDWAIVGARRDDVVATNAGAAFIYRREGGVWTKFQELRPAEIEFRDRFGYSVAISGTTIAVGARLDGDLGFKSGSVYVFEFDASQGMFVQTQKLLDASGSSRDQFGQAVGIDGDTMVVGARRDGTTAANSGAVIILERTPAGFQQTKRIKVADATEGDQLGFSVGISGDTIAVGAWKDNEDGKTDNGSAYVFERDSGGVGNWGQVAKLVPSDTKTNDWFGFAVDVDGDNVVVGKPIRNPRAREGNAYIFSRNQGGTDNWGESKVLASPNSAPRDQYGHSVRLDGNNVIVGARLDKIAANNAGAAYLFNRNLGGSDNWGLRETFLGQQGEQYGFAADIEGNTVLVGANLNDTNAKDSGAVYFEDLRTKTATVTVQVNENQLSGSGLGDGTTPDLTPEQLAPIAEAAADYWRQSGSLTPAQLQALDAAQVSVASLDGTVLGYQSGGNVTIDADAAGHGWYVDQTPHNFGDDSIGDRMDLLSNVIHEMGHVIGLEDRYAASARDDVMYGFLQVGERSVGETESLDILFAGLDDEEDGVFGF